MNFIQDLANLDVVISLTLKSFLWMTLVGIAALVCRRTTASLRHLVWGLGIAGLLALPVVDGLLPDGRAGALPALTWESPGPAPRADVDGSSRGDRHDPRVLLPDLGSEAMIPRSLVPETAHAGAGAGAVESRRGVPAVPGGMIALGGWFLFAVLLGLRLVLRYRSAIRLLSRLERFDSERVREAAARAGETLGLAGPVHVLVAPRGTVPMSWGLGRAALVLPRDAGTWSADRLSHVLIHELAHVARRDHLTQLLAEIATVLQWFNPWTWVAASRMRELRELAADDVVLTTGARPDAYATDLLDVARSLSPKEEIPMAAIAFTRTRPIQKRLLAILAEGRKRHRVRPVHVWIGVGALSFLLLPLAGLEVAGARAGEIAPGTGPVTALPKVGEPFALMRGDGKRGSTVDVSDDGSWNANWYDDHHSGKIQTRGKIRFTDDESGILSISRRGYFKAELKRDGIQRRIEVKPGDRGELDYRYWVDGKSRTFDEDGRTWLAAALPEFFRRSGVNTEERVRRILDRDGADGVYREIGLIQGDHVQRRYLVALLEESPRNEVDLHRALKTAGRELGSDYELAEFLIGAGRFADLTDKEETAYIEAVGTLDSDYEHRRVLTALLKKHRLTRSGVEAVLRSGKELHSDYELAELLLLVGKRHDLEGSLLTGYLDAVGGIGSDYERRRVLDPILDRGDLSPSTAAAVLERASGIGSDYELAELLIDLTGRSPVAGELIEPFFASVASIGSDYEQGRVLRTVVSDRDLSTAALLAVLRSAARGIGSDHEQANLLVEAARRFEIAGEVEDAFLDALATIGSKHDTQRVESALYRGERTAR